MNRCELDSMLAMAQIGSRACCTRLDRRDLHTDLLHEVFTPDGRAMLTGLAGVLGTIVTQQSGYFFARHRPPTGSDDDVPPAVPAAASAPLVQPLETPK